MFNGYWEFIIYTSFCQSQKKFVRTLFDYDPRADDFIPCQQAGIAFKRGEILQIVSQNDSHWWQVIFEDFCYID